MRNWAVPATFCPMGPRARCWGRGVRRVRTISPADENFLRLLRDNPDLWERIKSGQVTLNNVVCKTPTADPPLTERTTETSTPEAETIRGVLGALAFPGPRLLQ